MIGLIMAGGKGTRMNLDNEKLLLKYKKPVILHVSDSLKISILFSCNNFFVSGAFGLVKAKIFEKQFDSFKESTA